MIDDIESESFNISTEKLAASVKQVSREGKLKPKAVIPVDLFGLPCDYDRINRIASENNLTVIEDAAQSFGAEYKGRMAGSLGHTGCTSFFPAKPLGCYGDGGAVFTGIKSSWAQYSILAADSETRNRIQEKLKNKGIPTTVYYPTPLHLQTAFADSGYRKGDFSVSEDCSSKIFSIPMHPYLNKNETKKICKIIMQV